MDSYYLTGDSMPVAMIYNIYDRNMSCTILNEFTKIFEPFDPLTQTITLFLSFNIEVDETFSREIGPSSPHFQRLDDYYEAICSRICPDAPKWDEKRPVMVAEFDVAEGSVEDCEIGMEMDFTFTTKWFAPIGRLDAILAAIADTDLMRTSGLEFSGICGVDEDAPAERNSKHSRLDMALYPLTRDGSKFYPIHFRDGRAT